ncbi:MAG: hypothetical protein M3Q00_01705 [Pseudomonadota bacterium]|nr:hypothetical protein [Pseudomonadota bacterium]
MPLRIGSLAWGANLLATETFSGWQVGGMLFSLTITSAFATCVAHELQHRPSGLDRAVARVVLAMGRLGFSGLYRAGAIRRLRH